jgi:predicted DNA-binding WGR domain protein
MQNKQSFWTEKQALQMELTLNYGRRLKNAKSTASFIANTI